MKYKAQSKQPRNVWHSFYFGHPDSWLRSNFKNGLYSLVMLALLVLGIFLFLPIVIKLAFNNINMLVAKIHGSKLKMDPQRVINLTGWQPKSGNFL